MFSGKTFQAVKGYKFNTLKRNAISRKMKKVKINGIPALTNGKIRMGLFFGTEEVMFIYLFIICLLEESYIVI